MLNFSRWIVSALAAAQLGALAVTELQPSRDDEVLEVLPAVTRGRPARAASAPMVVSPAAVLLADEAPWGTGGK